MINRRSFIRSASVLGATPFLNASWLTASSRYIGIQLYTVRDDMQKDPKGTLRKVAAIGYNSLEGATYTGSQKFYGMGALEFSKFVKGLNCIMPSAHYRLGEDKDKGNTVNGTMLHEWDKAVEDAHKVGIQYMVCAFLSVPERGNADRYKYLADEFNKAGEKCKQAGIQFAYHNHDFEFIKQGDAVPYDILLNQTDKDLVKMELDLYWVKKAGHDPIDLFNKHPGRFPLWHVKDMDKTSGDFTEVGNGNIDFKKIFASAKQSGMKYFFVEQDKCPGSPFDSISKSFAYIKGNLG
ncbi:MAG TPA: sugar phosphate isomerase/epimerase [Flavitalea sp.]|nr:sugar phosphate isomerase/epimerase [Flavitalea sp.]